MVRVCIHQRNTDTNAMGGTEYLARQGGIEGGHGRPSAIRTPMRENCNAILHDSDVPNKMIGAQDTRP